MKYFLLLSFSLVFVFWLVKAENLDIWNVYVRFCSEEDNFSKKHISLYTESWKNKKECLLIGNNSDKSWYIDIHLVSQIKTSDGNKWCSLPWESNDIITKYIRPSWSGYVSLGAFQERKEYIELSFPIWISWKHDGCIWFFAVWESTQVKSEWTRLQIINRKANLFDVWVDNKEDILSQLDLKKIWKSEIKTIIIFNNAKSWLSWDDTSKKIQLNLWAENRWNVDQIVVFSGKLKSIFGFKSNISGDNFVIKRSSDAVYNSGYNTFNIPEYHWLFWFKLNINNYPHFDFDTSLIPKDKLKGNEWNYTIVFFVVSWLSMFFWIIILTSIFMIYRIIYKKNIIKKLK